MEWKISKIIPIIKPLKDKFDVSSYRPIALLPILLKCFNNKLKELIVCHFEEYKILPNGTMGFTKGMSTTDVHYHLISCIKNNKYLKKFQIIISIDFSKAFDKVNILKLIKMLHQTQLDPAIIN